MQFSLVGSPSTWDSYGVDGDHDGRVSPYDPTDAIPAAARYLRAPRDYRAALFAYNHADWYVNEVLAKAAQYRGNHRTVIAGGGGPKLDSARAVLDSDRVTLTPIQRSDLRSGQIDERVVATLAWIARRHSVAINALKSDHLYYTVDGNVSNHSFGRAMDIDIVDHEICRGTRTGRCAQLVRELAAVKGADAVHRADLLLGPRRARRPAWLRPRRPLRPHPRGLRWVAAPTRRVPVSGRSAPSVPLVVHRYEPRLGPRRAARATLNEDGARRRAPHLLLRVGKNRQSVREIV